MRASALVLAAAVWCAPAAADDAVAETRVAQWTRLRREKAARTAPPRPGVAERALLAVEQAKRPRLFGLSVAGLRPRVGDIASGSETAAGVRLWHPDIGGSRVDVQASAFYSIRGYEYYDLQAGRLRHLPARSTRDDDVYEMGDVGRVDAGRAIAYGSVRYRHYPETAFCGLGAAARADGRTSFLSQDAVYELVTGYEGRWGAATVRGGLRQAFVGPGTDEDVPTVRILYDDRSAPGLDRQPDLIHLAASVLLDRRDTPGNPHRGGMIAAGAARFDERGGGEFTFNRISGDARAFASLGSPQRVLALRALATADRPDAGARVPFYLQEPLGGSRTLRGFRAFRFRGEKVLLLQAEYRWEAWPALELALFADAGRAYGPGEDFAIRDLESDLGFGVRLKTHDAVIARIDVARGREDTRCVFRLGPSF